MISWMKEKLAALPRRAPEPADPPGVTVPVSLVRSAKLAAWMAYFALVYFLLLYTLDIARDRSGAVHITHIGTWIGEVFFYLPYVFGFAVVAVGIPYVAKIAIPVFMTLDWRTNLWPKMWALFIATAVSLVVIAGTFTVQGDTLLERDRESAVAVDTVAQEAAVLTARIADAQHRLDEMTGSESQYIRTAASMSPEAYDRFVAARQGDWQHQRLQSYRAQSEEAESLRNTISELRAQQARQTVTSAVAGRVTTTETSWIAATLGWLEGARAILLSLVMDIVCLIMPWIALRLEQARNRQMEESGRAPAPETVMIEDHTADAPVTPQPMEKPREAVFDAETGEELQRITPRSYWRKKKGKPQQVQTAPEHVEDERGYEDARTAMAMSGAMPGEIDLAAGDALVVERAPLGIEPQVEHPHEQQAESDKAERKQDASDHASQPTTEMSEEELAAGYAELDAQSEAPAADDAHTLPNNEGVLVDEEQYGPPAPRRVLEEA